MKTSRIHILSTSLNQMPDKFTSQMFGIAARKNGLTDREVRNGVVGDFLKKYTKRGETQFVWIKKESKNVDQPQKEVSKSNIIETNQSIEITEEFCINFLKSKGCYKIIKYTEL